MHIDVVDFKKKKRAKESQKAMEKNHEDHAWKDLCEDLTKLKISQQIKNSAQIIHQLYRLIKLILV